MEGRQPPPKAEHPFPDKVNFREFWGTPYSKALIKSFCIATSAWFLFVLVNAHYREENRGPFGIVSSNLDDVSKRPKINAGISRIFSSGLPLVPKSTDILDPAMRFDDGVEFLPHKESAFSMPREEGQQ